MGNCYSVNGSVDNASKSESRGRSKNSKSNVRPDGKPAHAVSLPPINLKTVNQKAVKGGDATLSRKRKNSISSTPDAELQYVQDPTNVGVKKNTPGMQYHMGVHSIQDHKAQERLSNIAYSRNLYTTAKTSTLVIDGRTDFEAVGNNSGDDMPRLDGSSKLNESNNYSGPSQVKNDQTGAEETDTKIHKEPRIKGKTKQKIKELEVRVKELMEEKDKLLNRLSEIGAMKMTDNNPNVTDLSDVNRPEKIVETFSELYDNEWTDAYEHLTKTQGKKLDQSVKLLLQALKLAYDICLSSTKERAITLRRAILSCVGLSDKESSELELQEIEKKMWEYRQKKTQSNLTRIEEEVKTRFRDQLETEMSSTLTLYIDGCVRICWFMCIKNPPMHLDFGEMEVSANTHNNKSGIGHFDKSKFVSYTKYGAFIDYVVWPAVYLYEGGPVMRKGVAQGSQHPTDTLVDVD